MFQFKIISILFFLTLFSCGKDSSSSDGGNPTPKQPNGEGSPIENGQPIDGENGQGDNGQPSGEPTSGAIVEGDGQGQAGAVGVDGDQGVDSEPVYKPLAEVFDDVSSIMKTTDIAGTLIKLRSVASPTFEYHRELEALILTVEKPSVAHIDMLVNAMYYSELEFRKLEAQYDFLSESGNAFTSNGIKLYQKIKDARLFAGAFGTIINAGFPKAVDLTYDNGLDVIRKVYWTTSEDAFKSIEKKIGSFDQEQKQTVMVLASEKGASQFSSRVAIEYFKEYTDKSLQAFHEIIDQLKNTARDNFMLAGFGEFPVFTHQQVVEFINKANFYRAAVAVGAFLQSEDQSHENVLAINKVLEKAYDIKSFLKDVIQVYDDISTEKILDLCQIGELICPIVSEYAKDNWDSPSIDDSVVIAEKLTYRDKDLWIQGVLHYFSALSNSDAHKLVVSAFQRKQEVAVEALVAIQNLTVQGTLIIAKELTYRDIDIWLLAAIEELKEITGEELYQLVETSFARKFEVADSAYSFVKVKTAQNVIKVASLMQYRDKDLWIDRALSDYRGLNTEDFKSLLEAAFSNKISIAENHIDKITDLNATGAVSIAKDVFQYRDINLWLNLALEKISTLSDEDAYKIIESAFNPDKDMAEKVLEKLTEITPNYVKKISVQLQYRMKDIWILLATEKMSEINIDEVVDILKNSYSKSSDIGIVVLSKKKKITVSDVVKSAAVMQYRNKAMLILGMIDSIVDLSIDDIPTLRNATGSHYDEIEQAVRDAVSA